MKQDFIKKLDEVLNYLYDNRKMAVVLDEKLIEDLFIKMPNHELEWRDVLNQFSDDKLINRHQSPEGSTKWGTVLSHRGRFLKESGGYTGKIKKENRDKIWNKIFEVLKPLAGVLLGWLLGYYLKVNPINNVNVKVDAPKYYGVDTIYLLNQKGKLDTALVRLVKHK